MDILADYIKRLEYDNAVLREVNRDWADKAEWLRRQWVTAQAGLREFAKDSLRLEDENAMLMDDLHREALAHLDTEGALRAALKDLALADLRLAEHDYMRGAIDKWELDAAADHAHKYTDDLGERYRRERAEG